MTNDAFLKPATREEFLASIRQRRSLAGADLSNLDLSGVKFGGGNLSGANLRNTNLSGARFAGTNLSEADLTGAQLTGAAVAGSNLARARYSPEQIYRAYEWPPST